MEVAVAEEAQFGPSFVGTDIVNLPEIRKIVNDVSNLHISGQTTVENGKSRYRH